MDTNVSLFMARRKALTWPPLPVTGYTSIKQVYMYILDTNILIIHFLNFNYQTYI